MIPSLPPPPPAHVVQAVPAAQTYRIAGYDVVDAGHGRTLSEKDCLFRAESCRSSTVRRRPGHGIKSGRRAETAGFEPAGTVLF